MWYELNLNCESVVSSCVIVYPYFICYLIQCETLCSFQSLHTVGPSLYFYQIKAAYLWKYDPCHQKHIQMKWNVTIPLAALKNQKLQFFRRKLTIFYGMIIDLLFTTLTTEVMWIMNSTVQTYAVLFAAKSCNFTLSHSFKNNHGIVFQWHIFSIIFCL